MLEQASRYSFKDLFMWRSYIYMSVDAWWKIFKLKNKTPEYTDLRFGRFRVSLEQYKWCTGQYITSYLFHNILITTSKTLYIQTIKGSTTKRLLQTIISWAFSWLMIIISNNGKFWKSIWSLVAYLCFYMAFLISNYCL